MPIIASSCSLQGLLPAQRLELKREVSEDEAFYEAQAEDPRLFNELALGVQECYAHHGPLVKQLTKSSPDSREG